VIQGAGTRRVAARRPGPQHVRDRARPAFLEPGLYFKSPIDQVSLGMALVFGTAGLPHILMRFFTVPTAQAGPQVGGLGHGHHRRLLRADAVPRLRAAKHVGPAAIAAVDAGGNMAGPLLAQFLGGGPNSFLGNFMLAFVSAWRSRPSSQWWRAWCRGRLGHRARPVRGRVPRWRHRPAAAAGARRAHRNRARGRLAITIGIAAKGQNVAHLVALAFAVAASANFPCVL